MHNEKKFFFYSALFTFHMCTNLLQKHVPNNKIFSVTFYSNTATQFHVIDTQTPPSVTEESSFI